MIAELVEEKIEGSLMDGLKDGSVLCAIANAVKPGSVQPPVGARSSLAFKQMENIQAFLGVCRDLQVAVRFARRLALIVPETPDGRAGRC